MNDTQIGSKDMLLFFAAMRTCYLYVLAPACALCRPKKLLRIPIFYSLHLVHMFVETGGPIRSKLYTS